MNDFYLNLVSSTR